MGVDALLPDRVFFTTLKTTVSIVLLKSLASIVASSRFTIHWATLRASLLPDSYRSSMEKWMVVDEPQPQP